MVMMDFAGGIFSMLQMLIDAYNYGSREITFLFCQNPVSRFN